MQVFQLPVSDLRTKQADIVNRVRYADHRFVLTKSNAPAAAVVPIEDLQLILQLREQARDEAIRERVASAPPGSTGPGDPLYAAAAAEAIEKALGTLQAAVQALQSAAPPQPIDPEPIA